MVAKEEKQDNKVRSRSLLLAILTRTWSRCWMVPKLNIPTHNQTSQTGLRQSQKTFHTKRDHWVKWLWKLEPDQTASPCLIGHYIPEGQGDETREVMLCLKDAVELVCQRVGIHVERHSLAIDSDTPSLGALSPCDSSSWTTSACGDHEGK